MTGVIGNMLPSQPKHAITFFGTTRCRSEEGDMPNALDVRHDSPQNF